MGLSSVLNIAKQALLAHQLSIEVASNNIANVDTPGYTRQSLELEANNATPISAGMLGGGVTGTKILRSYDQFMVQELASQQSGLGNLQAQQDSMKLVETVFNEAPGLGINDLMSKFWSNWQTLADSPNVPATRQSVIQSAQTIIDQLHTMTGQITQAKSDIGTSLDTAVGSVNSTTSQIASLNVQIATAESASGGQANDLRDKRDSLVQNLSKLLKVSYFEDKNGNYTVLMADGHSLVQGDQASKVNWANDQLLLVSKDSKGAETTQAIGNGAALGGQIGGWLEVSNNLAEGNPNNILGQLNAFANSLIREVNQQHSQGVGLTLFSSPLTGSEQDNNVARLTSTLDPSSVSANTTIPAGTITINDRPVGKITGGPAVNGLAMTKAANAVTAINNAATGVTAKLTTLMAGAAVTDPGAANVGSTISFDINGVAVNYTIALGDVGAGNASTFAGNLVGAINTALNTYNGLSTTANPITIQAAVGDGTTNGGALNAIVLTNTKPGDQSNIIVGNLTSSVAGVAASTGLTAGTYNADATHNTGQLTLFSTSTFTLKAGSNDYILAQLGLTGPTVSSFDTQSGDGTIQYGPATKSEGPLLTGYNYADQLATDKGSFDIWLYNKDGSLAMPQPVTVSLNRDYDLNDVVHSINAAMTNAGAAGMVTASISGNSLCLTPDATHQFAFANDTSNFLQVAGLNTFFSGNSAASIGLNSLITNDPNTLTAATVGSQGQIFSGDNSNALKITAIQNDTSVAFTGGSPNTLDGFYNSLVGQVGNTTSSLGQSYDSSVLINQQVSAMRDSVSGVSLDEEMANLIKYQQAYTAAARLITMSDDMMKTLLAAVVG